ncbi:hypothetical protein O23A_p2164 [Aeromonas salmonicida]|nr:hypothetical protein O23A_p2164 [Aeromonas salmonicida]
MPISQLILIPTALIPRLVYLLVAVAPHSINKSSFSLAPV